jgi:hypothetical protein
MSGLTSDRLLSNAPRFLKSVFHSPRNMRTILWNIFGVLSLISIEV